jgi:hypothetical protein
VNIKKQNYMSVTIQVFFFNGTPSYFELPLMIESTFDVKSATETKPLSADYGDAGIPKNRAVPT